MEFNPRKADPMNPDIIFYIILAILIFDFILENILSYLNLEYKKKPLPEEIKSIYSPEQYQKSLDYQRTNIRFGFLTRAISFIAMMTLLGLGLFGTIYAWTDTYFSHPIPRALLFFGVLVIASDILS
ncbi:MAG: M48 family peptidase, partial [Bacteroidota bacterium]